MLLLCLPGGDNIATKANLRPDHNGTQRRQFESHKKKIYATQKNCGICGKPVDFKQKFPHPLSPCIDHIIPVSRGGHPSAMENLQLAHMCCNRQKSDKLVEKQILDAEVELISNRVVLLMFIYIEIVIKSWYNICV